jgi:pyrroline-5-carboxylate reductase
MKNELKSLNLTIIGPGVMAEAILTNLLSKNLITVEKTIVSGPHQPRLDDLSQRFGVKAETNNLNAIKTTDVALLTVKPQQIVKVLSELHGGFQKDALLISIAAGISMQLIAELSGHSKIVRAMPNTPARIGKGMTLWTATPQVTAGQLEIAKSLFSAMGTELQVEDEEYVEKATALSGTGPSYVYLFMEALVDAGVHLGFPRRMAETMVIETLRGSVEFYDQASDAGKHLAALRNQVTSPGGTSAEALYFLEKAGFRTALSRAVWAAYQRTLELGQNIQRTTKD